MTGFSIRARLFLSLLAAIAVLAGAASLAIYQRAKTDINELFDYEMKQMAFTLGMHLSAHPDLQTEPLLRAEHDFVTQVWRARTLLATSRAGQGPDRALSPGFGAVGAGADAWRTFTAQAGEYTLQVAQPFSQRHEFAARIAFNAVLPAVAMLPVGGIIIWFVIGFGLKPIRAVTRDLRARDPETLMPVAVNKPPVEIAPMLSALNSLLARLDIVLRSERQFIADASHELRTPATALGLQLDLVEGAATPEEQREALRDLRGGVDRMQRLIEQILTLARLDAQVAPRREQVDLATFSADLVAEFEQFAASRSIELKLHADRSGAVHADPAALRALLRNLIDNAIRYSPPAGEVTVAVERPADRWIVSVTDTGPGIPAALRQKVFARFFREGADAGDGGSGLGLNIAKRAADRIGAELHFEDGSKDPGLTAVITFAKDLS